MKKTIVFVDNNGIDYNGNSLKEKGLGGAETAIINMSNSLAKSNEVHIYNYCKKPDVYNNVTYHNIQDEFSNIVNHSIDLLVIVRNADILNSFIPKELNIKKTVLWAHDMPDSDIWITVVQNYNKIDKILVLSEWHKNNLMEVRRFPPDKIIVTRNGINPELFNKGDKIKGKCIYSSTPFRGLDVLVDIWSRIKEQTNAELHVFSSMKTYSENISDEPYKHVFSKAKENGIILHGSVTQEVLAKHMKESEVLLYPNTFDETSCITAMEAQECGTFVITSAKAALPETVKSGILIQGDPYSKDYQDKFVKYAVDFLNGKIKTKEIKFDRSWDSIAKEWEQILFTEEQKPKINTENYWNDVYTGTKALLRDDVTRFNFINKFVKDNDTIIDLGCGTGEFVRFIKNKRPSCQVTGTDFSKSVIDNYKEIDKKNKYEVLDVTNITTKEKYDFVVAQHLLEHFENPKDIINNIKTLLKDKAKLVIVMPLNDDPWHEHHQVWTETDIINLMKESFPNESLLFKVHTIRHKVYQDGRFFEEMIIIRGGF